MECLNALTHQIIGSAMKVHRSMGPGLLESVYISCLSYELTKAGLLVEQEKEIPLFYEGVKLDQTYRLDLIGQEQIIIEVKSVESINATHKAQLLSYLKLTDRSVGLLINFNVPWLKDGICRVVNNFKQVSHFVSSNP